MGDESRQPHQNKMRDMHWNCVKRANGDKFVEKTQYIPIIAASQFSITRRTQRAEKRKLANIIAIAARAVIAGAAGDEDQNLPLSARKWGKGFIARDSYLISGGRLGLSTPGPLDAPIFARTAKIATSPSCKPVKEEWICSRRRGGGKRKSPAARRPGFQDMRDGGDGGGSNSPSRRLCDWDVYKLSRYLESLRRVRIGSARAAKLADGLRLRLSASDGAASRLSSPRSPPSGLGSGRRDRR